MNEWLYLLTKLILVMPVVALLGLWLYAIGGEVYHQVQAKRMQELQAHSVDVEVD